jgi:hypothetical protein
MVVKWAWTSVCAKALRLLDTVVDDASDYTGDRAIGIHAHRLCSVTELDATLHIMYGIMSAYDYNIGTHNCPRQ